MTLTCQRLTTARHTAGVVKMRRGLTAKYMAQLVSMREVYEAIDTWAAEIDAKSQRVSQGSSIGPFFLRSRRAQSLEMLCIDGKWPTLHVLHWHC